MHTHRFWVCIRISLVRMHTGLVCIRIGLVCMRTGGAHTHKNYTHRDLVHIHIGLARGAHVHTQSPSKTCTRQAKHAHGRLNVRTAGKMCARPCKCAHGRQNVRTALQMCARPAKCAHGQLNVRTDLRPCAYARGDVHTHCVRMVGVFTLIKWSAHCANNCYSATG